MDNQGSSNLVQLYPGSSCVVHKNAFAWIVTMNQRENCRIQRFIESIFTVLTAPNDRDMYAEEGEYCMKSVPSDVMKHVTGCVVHRFGESVSHQVYPTIREFLLRQQKWNQEPPKDDSTENHYVESVWDFEFSPQKDLTETQ